MGLTKLGPYRLEKMLGQGGMGSVHAATDETNGQRVAVKILSPRLATEEGFRARFESEIDSLKKLRHPNIVRLYGYGEDQGHLFYAMELIDGTSLEDELQARRRFDWREVTHLSIQLCRALKHAHDHGIIHRDIKPANLLLTNSGEVKLSDFGIARLFGNTRLTSDGGLLGTAEYMAPEQADGRGVTERSDQYSLGGVMYALLAGRAPFRAESIVEMLHLQRYAEVASVRRYAPDTPAELDRIILQLLEKDPQKRFVNTLLLSRSLEAMERGLSLPPSTQPGDDFILSEQPATSARVVVDPLANTVAPTSADSGQGIEPEPVADRADGSARTIQPRTEADAPVAKLPPSEPAQRFVKVDDETAATPSWQQELWQSIVSAQTLVILACLLAIGGGLALALRAPSADQLYSEIESAADKGGPAELRGVEPQMHRFLELYADDDRAPQVRVSLDEVATLRTQRELENKARGLRRASGLSSVERAYRDAVALKNTDPPKALLRFQALVDLFGNDKSDSNQTWVARAQKEIDFIQRQTADETRDDRASVQQQLTTARELAKKDPEEARKLYLAIMTLYGDKPWAAELVAEARAALPPEPAAASTLPPKSSEDSLEK